MGKREAAKPTFQVADAISIIACGDQNKITDWNPVWGWLN